MKNILFVLFIALSISLSGQGKGNDYGNLINNVSTKRNSLEKDYNAAESSEKEAIIDLAREYLFETITVDIFSKWYGTKWDFFGNSKVPHQGSVSAGYFVTNILSDAGFLIPKEKWAEAGSESIVEALVPNNFSNLSNTSISKVEDYFLSKGNGLYIVGLDKHIGFVSVNKGQIKFVHANYYQPEIGVMSEKLDSWNPLRNSKSRIIGKLLTDDMMIHWLNNLPYN